MTKSVGEGGQKSGGKQDEDEKGWDQMAGHKGSRVFLDYPPFPETVSEILLGQIKQVLPRVIVGSDGWCAKDLSTGSPYPIVQLIIVIAR